MKIFEITNLDYLIKKAISKNPIFNNYLITHMFLDNNVHVNDSMKLECGLCDMTIMLSRKKPGNPFKIERVKTKLAKTKKNYQLKIIDRYEEKLS